ncbi:MAG: copper-binding protein [Polyangiaceae bacterium]
MTRSLSARGFLIASLMFGSAMSVFACTRPAASAPTTYTTKGTIKSFGPDRKFVNIFHDTIPGFMEAMTMSFEPGSPDQLNSINEGDRIEFTFVDQENGRRVIQSLKKL